jgi:hypothetical protein
LVLIHRTEDDDGKIESTNGMHARRFRIEAALLPILRRMHAAAGGAGRVLPRMPVEKHLAPMRRRHVEIAGITRADLFPPLPDDLVSPDESLERLGANGHVYVKTKETGVGEAGFEPATTSTQSSCTTGLCDSPWVEP